MKNICSIYLVDVVEEVAAFHQQDVVHVGAGGGLVQGEPPQTHVAGQVFVQHPGSWGTRVRSRHV